ncbi:hypothetical protein LJR220_003845 [Bradyrhizobium sp. LjRoot220]|uniref:hypothetical protein n=1 Tax=Bradyrhizobium sp. LjRoot220 TaxID=3342284 RepID=UPI003ECE6370
MPERIFLTYTNATALPYQGAVLGHHVVLNYVDSNGKHHTLQGMPEQKFDRNATKLSAFLREEVLSDGANNKDSPFQRLRAKTDEPSDSVSSRPRMLIAEGQNLRSQWDRMTDFGDEVNSTGYEYRPLSQNSNSFAAAALKRAGFFGPGTAFPEIFDRLLVVDPVSGETRPVRVPGFDQRLMNPINQTATPLTMPARPFVPASAAPVGDRQGSFDRRFGDPSAGSAPLNPNLPAWMKDVGGTLVDANRRPERYLGRRIAGKPEASVFDVGAPAVPFVPSTDVLSRGRPSSLDDRFGNWTSSPAGITPRNPNLALPPTEPGRPPGIFNDTPMPSWTTPPPLGGLMNNSRASSNSDRSWIVTGVASDNPTPPRQTGGNNPVRYLGRRIADQPQASAFDMGVPAVRFAPSDDRSFSGGLAGRIAALTGMDPDKPGQPPPGGLLGLLLAARR